MNPQNITDFHKGEALAIQFFGKAPGGQTVIASPAAQVITITIGASYGKSPTDLQFSNKSTLVDDTTGEYLISLSDSDLSSLREGKTYYYNIWSTLGSEDPRLQAKGELLVNHSLGVV